MDCKEKLELARDWYNDQSTTQKEKILLESIFPELKMSEDEKIRKRLIEWVEEFRKLNPTNADHNAECSEVLAWLEKQGSQNLANSAKTCKVEPKFKVGDVIRLKGSAVMYMIERVTDTTYYTNGWSWSIERCEEDYELVEQKNAWSEDDDINLGKAIWYVENPAPMVVKDSMLVEWLKSLNERYTWKPSDEQMSQLECVAIQNKDNMLGKELMTLFNDLKKLKDEK